VSEFTLALFVTTPVPIDGGIKSNSNICCDPTLRFPVTLHVYVRTERLQPKGAAINVRPAGKVSVTTTFVASDGPAFSAVNVIVVVPGGAPITESGENDFVIERSAAAFTGVEVVFVENVDDSP